MITLTQHPLSAAFPAMSLVDLAALTDDIAANGLRQAIVMYEGQVLDGWHRYQACLAAKETPRFVEYDGSDPVAFVMSLNLARRHLTASQRAAAVVACGEWQPGGAVVGGEPGSPPPLSNEQMAKAAETTPRTIVQAKRAHEAGLGEPVRDGKVSAKTAAAVAKLPEKQRAEVTAKPPEEWQDALARKTTPAEEEALDEASDNAERIADLVRDFEAATRIIEADDKAAEAWAEVKTLTQKYEELNRLYDAKCRELAEMTKEARRWMRKAQALEKGRAA